MGGGRKKYNHCPHLWVWYCTGNCFVNYTMDLRQPDSNTSEHGICFMLWLRDYVDNYVQPIVKDVHAGCLHDNFKASLEMREKAFQNLSLEVLFCEKLCPPLGRFCNARQEPRAVAKFCFLDHGARSGFGQISKIPCVNFAS